MKVLIEYMIRRALIEKQEEISNLFASCLLVFVYCLYGDFSCYYVFKVYFYYLAGC